MRRELLNALDPRLGIRAADTKVFFSEGDQIVEAILPTAKDWVPVLRGVPCFLQGSLRPDLTEFAKRHGLAVPTESQTKAHHADQAKTNATFSDKWRRFRNYGLETSHQEFLRGWYCKKLGLETQDDLKAFYRDKKMILEIGP